MAKSWYRLDTAALIFPATMRRKWRNVFRMSATLKEDIDPEILQRAVYDLMPRFPSFYVRLKKGFFWCYLESCNHPPKVREDFAYPLSTMSNSELKDCCIRVLYYKKRFAVEFFHAITDGTGGSIYLCSLVARYVYLKYGVSVPECDKILTVDQTPSEEELEDSFFKNSIDYPASRKEENSYVLHGTPEEDGFLHIITGIINTDTLKNKSHEYGASITVFLAAVMAQCLIEKQAGEKPKKRQRWIKVTIPVNLRRLYGSKTLRNFALTLNIGVDPKRGEYSLKELCDSIGHQLAAGATKQNMAAMIAANVLPQVNPLVRFVPVGIKHFFMEMVYRDIGERKGSLNISNLGLITLPGEMKNYLERVEFTIGVQRSYPNNCSLASYGGKTFINMIRNIKESDLERRFFSKLVELGVPVEIESNGRE